MPVEILISLRKAREKSGHHPITLDELQFESPSHVDLASIKAFHRASEEQLPYCLMTIFREA